MPILGQKKRRAGHARTSQRVALSVLTAASLSAMTIGSLGVTAASAATAHSISSLHPDTSVTGTLSVWSYFDGKSGLAELSAHTALFNKVFPKVKVTYVQLPFNSLDPKLLDAAAAHTGPDVVQDNPDVDLYELAQAGAISNLGSYWSSYKQHSEFPSSALWKYDGTIRTVQAYVNVLGIWYNKTLLNKLGLKPATTVAQLAAQLPKIKAAGDTGLMVDASPGILGTWQLYPWIADEGGSFCSLKNSGTKSVLSDLSSWVQDGYIPHSSVTWQQDVNNSGFLKGNMAYLEDGNWIDPNLSAAKFAYGDEQMFIGPSGTHVLPGGEGFSVGGFSSQKQLAWDYIQYGWLSKQSDELLFKQDGVIPTRYDVAPALAKYSWASPFLTAVKSEAAWPSNSNANKTETDLGNVLSGLFGGSSSASSAVSQAASEVQSDLSSGTGSCSGS